MAENILVRATRMVFYGGLRHRPGMTFTITDEAHFSPSSMERVAEPGVRDDAAAAVEASPKQRGPGGSETKQKRPGVTRGPVEQDPGI